VGTQTQQNVVTKGGIKMELNNEKMKQVEGGASITSAMINAISKAVNTLYELGKQTGSAIRRLVGNSYCPIK